MKNKIINVEIINQDKYRNKEWDQNILLEFLAVVKNPLSNHLVILELKNQKHFMLVRKTIIN